MGAKMQAIAIDGDGGLALAELDRPEAGTGEVVIDIRAAGVNRADLLQRRGVYPPPAGAPDTMGLECAGVVSAVGTGVSRWAVGDQVCALLSGGGYAGAVAVDEGSVLPMPAGMDFVQAACLPEAMMTVWANVFLQSALQPGEAFLCQGGTSGIGVMAIQMAREWGASAIFATAGSDAKVQVMADLGASRPINYRSEDFTAVVNDAGGADVVLDMVGGDYVQQHIGLIRQDGRICNIAYQNGPKVSLNLLPLMLKRATLTGTTLRARKAGEKRALRDAVETHFWGKVESGAIKPVLDSQFPLAEADAAQARMQEGGHVGKIVLTVGA
ncbi:MAG: NAD(P)H-quinone oxidoreductase [Pseudomonadota bacterium]